MSSVRSILGLLRQDLPRTEVIFSHVSTASEINMQSCSASQECREHEYQVMLMATGTESWVTSLAT